MRVSVSREFLPEITRKTSHRPPGRTLYPSILHATNLLTSHRPRAVIVALDLGDGCRAVGLSSSYVPRRPTQCSCAREKGRNCVSPIIYGRR